MRKSISLLLLSLLILGSSLINSKPVFSSGVSEASAVENSWVKLAPMHIARAYLGVAMVNGKIYAIGGSNASGVEPSIPPSAAYGNIELGGFVGVNEEYDPATNKWAFRAPMPTPRMAFAIAVCQGEIYCIGGRSTAGDISGGYTDVNEVYNPATDSWENKAPMPIATGWITANVVDGKIYIPDSSGTNYVYNPSTNTWNSSVPTPQNEALLNPVSSGYETTGVMAPKMIYSFDSSVNAYNPENDSWTTGANSPIDRYGFRVAVLNDTFYVVGGYTYNVLGIFAPTAANELYFPIGYGSPDPSYVLEHSPPKISVLSPLNQMYSESSLSVVFTVDKPVNWTGYSLDRKENVTITGNTTITGLSSSSHNITVYANDTFGNMGASETTTFTMPEPFPVVFVIAASAFVVIVISAILLVYFKKRKH